MMLFIICRVEDKCDKHFNYSLYRFKLLSDSSAMSSDSSEKHHSSAEEWE